MTGDRQPDWPDQERSRRSGRHGRPPEGYGNPGPYGPPDEADDYGPQGSYGPPDAPDQYAPRGSYGPPDAPDQYASPGSYGPPDRFAGPDPLTAPGRFDRSDPLTSPGRFDEPDPLTAPGRFRGPDPLTAPGQYAPPGPYGPPDGPAQADPYASRPPRRPGTPPGPPSYGQSGPHARVDRGPDTDASDQTDPSADRTDPFSQRDRYAAQARLGPPDRYAPAGGSAGPDGYGPPASPGDRYDQRGRPDSFDQPAGPRGRSGYGPPDSADPLATRAGQNGYGRPAGYGPPNGDAPPRFDDPRGPREAPGAPGERNGYRSAAPAGDGDDGPFRWRPPAGAPEPEALAPLPDYHGETDHQARPGPRDWDASQEHEWDLSDSSMNLAEPLSGPVDRAVWPPEADEFDEPGGWDDAGRGEGLIPGLDSRRGRGGRGGRPRRRIGRVLAPLLALVLLVVLGAGGYKLYRHFQSPDFTGPGFGEVTVQVPQGASAFSMAPELVKLGVVASTSSFISAAKSNTNPDGLEPGFFRLHHHMNSALAYALLINPKSRIQSVVTIPEGLRETQILATLEAKTGTSASAFAKALTDTSALGLPSYANGNPEGFLFPATYNFNPGTSALSMLQTMVARFNQEAASINLPAAAKTGKMQPNQIITIASILEAEAGAPQYYADVAEVIYNRLNQGIKLGLDSTVNYALHRFGVSLTNTQMEVNSPYNTFIHLGLPPGPIDSPGNAAIEAALHPAHGPLLYFVTVNIKTGLTKFATTSTGFQQLVNECDANNSC